MASTRSNSAFPPTWSKWVCEFSTVTGRAVSSFTTGAMGTMPRPLSKSKRLPGAHDEVRDDLLELVGLDDGEDAVGRAIHLEPGGARPMCSRA